MLRQKDLKDLPTVEMKFSRNVQRYSRLNTVSSDDTRAILDVQELANTTLQDGTVFDHALVRIARTET